jgi:hypothetical protein
MTSSINLRTYYGRKYNLETDEYYGFIEKKRRKRGKKK